MKKITGFVLLILVCQTKMIAQPSAQLKWLNGTWTIKTPNGTMVEHWKVVNDSTLAGRSLFVKNGTDTIPQESVELSYRNGSWSYIPTVATQNGNQPVPFKFILLKGTEFICENPAHDFPQRISYRRINDQLFASIEGTKNGKYGKQNFDFGKQER